MSKTHSYLSLQASVAYALKFVSDTARTLSEFILAKERRHCANNSSAATIVTEDLLIFHGCQRKTSDITFVGLMHRLIRAGINAFLSRQS